MDLLDVDAAHVPARGRASWLAATLRDAVADGRLGIDVRLPASRVLAGQLGVPRPLPRPARPLGVPPSGVAARRAGRARRARPRGPGLRRRARHAGAARGAGGPARPHPRHPCRPGRPDRDQRRGAGPGARRAGARGPRRRLGRGGGPWLAGRPRPDAELGTDDGARAGGRGRARRRRAEGDRSRGGVRHARAPVPDRRRPRGTPAPRTRRVGPPRGARGGGRLRRRAPLRPWPGCTCSSRCRSSTEKRPARSTARPGACMAARTATWRRRPIPCSPGAPAAPGWPSTRCRGIGSRRARPGWCSDMRRPPPTSCARRLDGSVSWSSDRLGRGSRPSR